MSKKKKVQKLEISKQRQSFLYEKNINKNLATKSPEIPRGQNPSWHYVLIVCLIVLGYCFKIYHLHEPPKFYFDEVYHGFTATQYLHGNVQAYDPWAKPPKDVAFEWTHPPLAKLIMAGFMRLFGENSLGWRLGSVLFGSLATVLSGVLAFQLFGSTWIALLTVFFLTFENLFLVQSRIAMNDIYFVCFMLFTLTQYISFKKNPSKTLPLVLTGMGLGLALSTKWTSFFLAFILALDFIGTELWSGRFSGTKVYFKIFCLGLVFPGLIYLASYAQFFILGGSWDQFEKLQGQMWYYHSQLKATHSYQSIPVQWLFNLRPVWMSTDYSQPEMARNIYNLGNLVILWSGLVAVLWGLFKTSWSWEKGFLSLCYFMFWVPWIFSPRIMLFYHYLPAIPFLCIFLSLWVNFLLKQKGWRASVSKGILVCSGLWFLVYYPNSVGIPVPKKFAEIVYYLIPSWK